MAPEQLEGAESDPRTDIFAFGATLYEMLTGRKAFEGKSQASLISAIMTAQPQPLSKLQPLATPLLERVVSKCLAKDPEDRWQSARDLEVELKWIVTGGGAAEVAAPAAVARFRKRLWLGWIVAACLLVALIAALAITYLRPATEARVVRFEISVPPLGASTQFPAISPDGQYVAIWGREAGQSRLWIHSLNSGDTSALSGTEGVDAFFWSPDSRQIGFNTASGLKKISLTRGVPQTIYNGRCRDTARGIATG
jgi:serine/threonine protein kinase